MNGFSRMCIWITAESTFGTGLKAPFGIMNARLIDLLLGQEPAGSLGCANTGITLMESDSENNFRLVYDNCTKHLEDLNYMNNKSVFSILGSRKL